MEDRAYTEKCDRGIIYALGSTVSPYVKIGRTTRSVQQRRAELESRFAKLAMPELTALYVVATVVVEQNLCPIETVINRMLAAHRYYGEWFELSMSQQYLDYLVAQASRFVEGDEWWRRRGYPDITAGMTT